jgi:hypothetical protein
MLRGVAWQFRLDSKIRSLDARDTELAQAPLTRQTAPIPEPSLPSPAHVHDTRSSGPWTARSYLST